jgi:hypothetical protein
MPSRILARAGIDSLLPHFTKVLKKANPPLRIASFC